MSVRLVLIGFSSEVVDAHVCRAGLVAGDTVDSRSDDLDRAPDPCPIPQLGQQGLCAALPGAVSLVLHVEGTARQARYVMLCQ